MANARTWGRSLETMLKDEEGFTTFKNFLKKEGGEDNIDFWKRIDNYRDIADKMRQQKEANAIFKIFVMNNGRRCVILKGATRSQIDLDLKIKPNSYIFDTAQKEIYEVMQRDPYQRYIKSESYKNLLI